MRQQQAVVPLVIRRAPHVHKAAPGERLAEEQAAAWYVARAVGPALQLLLVRFLLGPLGRCKDALDPVVEGLWR